ncbi:MAG: pilus assembly FimT family protein [Mobilitalea sp.]
MKKNKNKVKSKAQNNQGFSLIELLISITVLVLIMIPLMNNFYQSMRMNKKANDIQTQSNLAASIMEGLKNYNMEDTIDQFTGVDTFDIVTGASDIKVLRLNGLIYEEVLDTSTLDQQTTFYFAIHGITEGSTAYDAIIKLDASTTYTPASSTMNSYPMPDAINLDVMANALLFSSGVKDTDTFDNNALTTYLQLGETYARQLFEQSSDYQDYLVDLNNYKNMYELAEMNGSPTPIPIPEVIFDGSNYPDYCVEATVKMNIFKTMKVIVNQDTLHTVEYVIEYKCNWPSGNLETDLQYPIATYNYAKTIENIYLFYRPSIFKDTTTPHQDYIEIDNRTTSSPINFYVAKQVTTPPAVELLPDVTITKISQADSDAKEISVFTNIPLVPIPKVTLLLENGSVAAGITDKVVKAKPKDRIFEATVTIFEYEANASDKYKKELYTLSSTREQ